MPLHAEHCALSRQRELPDWPDSCIETRQPDLPLAILSAFVDARRVSVPPVGTSVQTAQSAAKPLYEPVCCENFKEDCHLGPTPELAFDQRGEVDGSDPSLLSANDRSGNFRRVRQCRL